MYSRFAENMGYGEKGQMERERFDAELYAPLAYSRPRRSTRSVAADDNDSGVASLMQFGSV